MHASSNVNRLPLVATKLLISSREEKNYQVPGKGQKGGGGRAAGGAKGSPMTRRALRIMTWGWVEVFPNVSKAFRRLDTAEGMGSIKTVT